MKLKCPECSKEVDRLFKTVDDVKGTIYVCKDCLVKTGSKGKEKK